MKKTYSMIIWKYFNTILKEWWRTIAQNQEKEPQNVTNRKNMMEIYYFSLTKKTPNNIYEYECFKY